MLQSHAELIERFGLFSGRCAPSIEPDGRLACRCPDCLRWRCYTEGVDTHDADATFPRYEVFTREHVRALAGYLHSRAASHRATTPLLVLEVGAGGGTLHAGLLAALNELSGECQLQLSATDSGARGLHTSSPHGAAVTLESCAAALQRLRPHVVLCCWMPLGVDWTGAFRSLDTVQEYLLVGETDSSLCGDAWRTWGRAGEDAAGVRPVPPYQVDGFRRVDLQELSRWQLCRTDERWAERGRSRTVSFRRSDTLR